MRATGGRTAAGLSVVLFAVLAVAPVGRAQAAEIVHVPADVGTIQVAIDASESGGTVVVAPGVYRENLRFNGKRVEVRSSHGPLATVVDGGAADDAVVTFQAEETRASVLRGFTVRNGRQGGIRIANASPTVVDNIVTSNSARDGAGIYMAGSSARVQNNLIRGNADRGGHGAGMYLVQTYGAEVVGNTFESNKAMHWGGGMALWTSEYVLILNNVFRANRAGHEGGAMYIVNYSDPLVSQNVFVDNEAGYSGGAISILVPHTYQGATFANNTMAANRAPKGSAITGNGDYLAVNNIMSGPPTGEVLFCDGAAGRLFYNDVYNGTATPSRWCPDTTGLVGNVSVDPRLAPDLSLAAGSPVIDAGHDDPLLPLLRPTDPNGTDRVQDGDGDGVAVADMGAYERPGPGLAPPATSPATYHPVSPSRILDTRSGVGSPATPLGPAGTRELQVTGRGGVPATGVSAVVLNVTATQPTAAGHLTAWPAGEPRPLASNLNFVPGQTVPNLVVVKVGPGGKVGLFNSGGVTHVVADVTGWYGPHTSAAGAVYAPLPPARILDTRSGLGAPAGRMGAASVVKLQVTGSGGVPATGVSAVVMNVTVTEPDAVSFLTAWPSGQSLPLASNLNYGPGQTVPNLVVVKVGAGGKVDLYNHAGSAHVVADVAGWFGTDTSTPVGGYMAVTPERILDTRSGLGAPAGKVAAAATLPLQVTGRGGLPAGAVSAVVLNVTVTDPTAVGFLTAWPSGDARPLASNLNFVPGQTVPNLVVVKVGADGKVNLFNNAGSAHVVADVAGWYGS